MSTSVNGWEGIPNESDSRLAWGTVPGTKKKVLCRKEALPLFLAILADINKQLIPLEGGPLDGWEYRETRTGQGLSCHASGTAIDFRYDVLLADNQAHWPKSKHDIMHKLLDKYVTSSGKRVFGWGGDWNRVDEMHLELIQDWSPGSHGADCTMADVLDCIKRLRIKPDGTTSIINIVVPPKKPVPPKPVPQPKPAPQPAPKPTSGPEWLRNLILGHGVPEDKARILWALGMRESGGQPNLTYPDGSPKDRNWNHDNAPFWDSGWAQINNRHLPEIKKLFGSKVDMKIMLDPEAAFKYVKQLSKNFTYWKDWGLAADGKTFDWSGYPADWVAKYAKDSEAGYLKYYKAWKPVGGTAPTPKPAPKPAPTPKPKAKKVSLKSVQPGKKNQQVALVQQALKDAGFTPGAIDGKFGPKTQAAYALFQKFLGYKGTDANGIPGDKSLTELGNKYGFTVTA